MAAAAPANVAVGQRSSSLISPAVNNFLKDVVAGTVGGLAVVAVGHPFDTVKVRLQTQSSANPLYSGALDCVRKTINWEGAAGLYKGVYSPLVGQMFFRASLFSTFGGAKRWLAQRPDGSTRPLRAADYYAAGAITGFAASFAEGPIDLFKSQVQVQIIRSKANPDYKPAYTTMLDCVRKTLAANGVRGPYQGLGATLLRNTPAFSVYFGTFEVIKGKLAQHQGVKREDLGAVSVLSAAGIAGPLYWIAIFPVDVIKSSMQTDSIIKSERVYPTMLEAAKKLWADGGAARFYRGFAPALLRATPANGIMLFTVDKMGAWLHSL